MALGMYSFILSLATNVRDVSLDCEGDECSVDWWWLNLFQGWINGVTLATSHAMSNDCIGMVNHIGTELD